MEKSKLLQVIAAIMITSMAVSMLSFSTSVVKASPDITFTPLKVRDNALVVFTLTVTNTGTENIENIVIRQTAGGGITSGFSSPMGGENSKENWYAVADNLAKAAMFLNQVRDNFSYAATNLTDAAAALLNAANLLYSAGTNVLSAFPDNIKNAGENLRQAANTLILAYNKLVSTDNADWRGVGDNITAAGTLVKGAGIHMTSVLGFADPASWVKRSGDNLYGVGQALENGGAALREANLDNTSENFSGAGSAENHMNQAGLSMAGAGADNLSVISVGYQLENVAIYLKCFGDNMAYARDNIRTAGIALQHVDNSALENTTLHTTGRVENKRSLLTPAFATEIRDAGTQLRASTAAATDFENENVYACGDNLADAATKQTEWLGPAFASNIIGIYGSTTTTSARYWIGQAGENLRRGKLNLSSAASCFGSAATALVAATAQIKATADLVPSGTGYLLDNLSDLISTTGLNGVILYPNAPENRITPSSTKTFSFLWNMPDISTENTYTVTVYPKRMDNSDITDSITNFTITVDGKVPELTVVVTQAGVTDNNLVGKVLDNGKATITITASEPLSALGNTYIDNRGGLNILGPITWDNWTKNAALTQFTYDFNVTGWTENYYYENVRVNVTASCAIDAYNLENTASATQNFICDVIKPVFADNGLTQFVILPSATQPGRTDNYRYSQKLQWSIKGRAGDNENCASVWDTQAAATYVTVTVNGAAASRDSQDNFIKTLILSNGQNSIVIRATDRVGNYVENRIDNIFIDNVKPTAACTQITRIIGGVRTWVTFSNDMKINDNTPWFKFAVTDPGYPTTGWGIFHKQSRLVTTRDNLSIRLDNDNNFLNDQDGFFVAFDNLDNMAAYDSGLTGVYENHWPADNLLATGTYFIHIRVNDNLHSDNENVSYRFYIDVSKPSTTAATFFDVTTFHDETTIVDPHVQKSTTLSLGGPIPAGEAGGVVTIYVDGVVAQTVTTTATATSWNASITLTAGSTQKVEVTLTDTAGNESDKLLYGYFMADGTAPTVTISSPVTATSTDKTSISITGTVAKDTWEIYTDLTVNIQVGGATPGVVTLDQTSGNFTSSATLGEGTNVITITARDAAGNVGSAAITIERTVTPLTTYAIILVVVALILAAIAIFRKEMK